MASATNAISASVIIMQVSLSDNHWMKTQEVKRPSLFSFYTFSLGILSYSSQHPIFKRTESHEKPVKWQRCSDRSYLSDHGMHVLSSNCMFSDTMSDIDVFSHSNWLHYRQFVTGTLRPPCNNQTCSEYGESVLNGYCIKCYSGMSCYSLIIEYTAVFH